MNKILCLCHTPLQILNITNLIVCEYPNAECDIIITDRIKNCAVLFENIKNSMFFSSVCLYHDPYKEIVGIYSRGIRKFIAYQRYCKIVQKELSLRDEYTHYIFGNWDVITMLPPLWLKKAKVIWCDEGSSSYSYQGLHVTARTVQTLVVHQNYFAKRINAQYLYRPEIADFSVSFERKKLPFLGVNTCISSVANKIFGFSEGDFIKEKYIYFDGPFNKEEGLVGNDKEILKLVSDIVGKENLLVKVHPRNSADYYLENGYHINANTSIPWEVFCMNSAAIAGKILISISSTALISPYLYCDMNIRCISLINFLDSGKFTREKKYWISFIRCRIFEQNPDIFILPKNRDDLKNALLMEEE